MNRWRDLDWLLLGLVLVIAVVGITEIYSATVGTHFAGVYIKQIYFLIAGVIVLFAFSRLDYKLLLESAPWLYAMAVAALGAVLVIGRVIFHSRRWIPVAGAHLQVSELVKLVIIIVVARYFAESRRSAAGLGDVLRIGVLVGVPMLLVLAEPDLGTALTYLPIAGMGLLIGKLRWRHFALLGLAGLLVLPIAWRHLHPYQKARLESFLRPEADPLGTGYQLLQSKIAVGSGGLWGKGIAKGSQTRGAFLPVPQTDFIFAAFAEEHGFVGGIAILFLYFLVLMRLIQDAQSAPDLGGGLLVMGVVAVLGFHVFVNIGMALGLMPVTGIPLPLMSSGGSSLLFTFAALGVAMNVRMSRFVN
ncbi:MAG TPA: rod shape-determining protein RodA [Terriglobales bacterium]|nr:rod shape-determining protein RodA [Terriglobales bacterium]